MGTRQRNGASSTAASSSPLGVTRISREPRFGDGGSWPLPGTRQDDLHGKLTGAHVAVDQGEDRLADLVAHGARGDQGRILAALDGGDAITAGEVATATGMNPATISTTLSRLAKTSEVTKANRGYQANKPAEHAATENAGTATPK